MKTAYRLVRIIPWLLWAVTTACSSDGGSKTAAEGAPFYEPGGGSHGTGRTPASPGVGEAAAGDGPESGGGGGGNGEVQPGTLTAGSWDDNLNFDAFLAYRAHQQGAVPPFSLEEQQTAHAAAPAPGEKRVLDIALVIDTTGSMGDEIAYLKAEFIHISQTIFSQYPNAEQRWSLVAYRDVGDDYVVQGADFGTSVTWFDTLLGQQDAAGGGDYPESPERALAHAATLSWRDGADAARLVFWVADAPHHDKNASAMAEAVRSLQARGVHVYPVASSGVDDLTEYTMRASAQLTGGRYLFLTDDSGVGLPHKEPTIPCYAVTKLAEAIERMVGIEMSGHYIAPDPAAILRTVGEPQDGTCRLSDGQTATIF